MQIKKAPIVQKMESSVINLVAAMTSLSGVWFQALGVVIA